MTTTGDTEECSVDDDMTSRPERLTEIFEVMKAAEPIAIQNNVKVGQKLIDEANKSISYVQADITAQKQASSLQRRLRWIFAVGSLVAAIILTFLSTRLDHGFWQISAELAGGALLTYVIVERGISALASVPEREVLRLSKEVEAAVAKAAKALEHSAGVIDYLDSLTKGSTT